MNDKSSRPYRMRVPYAEEDERQNQARLRAQRVRHLRTWVSSLFFLCVLSLGLWAIFLALSAIGTTAIVSLMLIFAFMPGSLAAWGAGIYTTWRTREWLWLAILALAPVVFTVATSGPPLDLPLVYVFPIAPAVAGLTYAWSKRYDIAPQVDDRA